ncbi:TRAP transporter substrate-binding protein [Pseudooceanicola spongiae]|jgi:tripartite ATP-independent transporter DctP family solute receptor|uniref:DctP family TRAP transporter solute-binding subunit n=1 Tax=Pseudooceanicola spongiae TaxID=2613965 RepID=A0A7L9WPI7_9RHOB|nr:TRAP transporter substrate-binding protein [Pseudooceanicola spongiae]QOL81346.1 DctP family TRAP transporter solute-binding subunit [Pseudooceanicola spongiae]
MTFTRFALSGALAALIAVPAVAEDWRGWNIHPEGYPNTVALESFAKDVAAKTDGRIEPTVYNNGTLGDQPDAIEQVRNGGLDFANFNMGPMGQIVPATNVMSLPFIFRDVDQMHRVMDGPVGQQFSDALAKEGLVALSWFDSGSRSFYNTKRPIKTPADMDGLKFRVMSNDLYVEMVDDLGGNATPMAYGEVYQSLKTGVIDGAENNYPSFESSNHYEVAKYYSITNHLIIPECICVSTATWEATSDEDKAIVTQAAIDAAVLQRDLWSKREMESRAKVEASGVEINEVDDPKAFQDAMAPVYAGFLKSNPDLESLVKEIQATE